MGNTLAIDKTMGELKIMDVGTSYFTGTQITGRVVINLQRDFPSNTLHLVLRGKEKVRLPRTQEDIDKPKVYNPTATSRVKNNSKYSQESCEIFNMTFPLYANHPLFTMRSASRLRKP